LDLQRTKKKEEVGEKDEGEQFDLEKVSFGPMEVKPGNAFALKLKTPGLKGKGLERQRIKFVAEGVPCGGTQAVGVEGALPLTPPSKSSPKETSWSNLKGVEEGQFEVCYCFAADCTAMSHFTKLGGILHVGHLSKEEAEAARKAKEDQKRRDKLKESKAAKEAREAREAREKEAQRKRDESDAERKARQAREKRESEAARKKREAEERRKEQETREAREAEEARKKGAAAKESREAREAREAREREEARRKRDADAARRESEQERRAREAREAKAADADAARRESEQERRAREAGEAKAAREASEAREAAEKLRREREAREAEARKEKTQADLDRADREAAAAAAAEAGRKAAEAAMANFKPELEITFKPKVVRPRERFKLTLDEPTYPTLVPRGVQRVRLVRKGVSCHQNKQPAEVGPYELQITEPHNKGKHEVEFPDLEISASGSYEVCYCFHDPCHYWDTFTKLRGEIKVGASLRH